MSRRGDRRARRLSLECLESRMVLATFYVSPLGSDAGLGTDNSPWQTLQKAANTVRAGDTVIVRPGDYTGFDLRTDGTANQRIAFRAEPGATIVQRNARTPDGINLEGADYVTIEGFTVVGMPRAGIRTVLNRHVEIRNNKADLNGTWGIFSGFSDDLVIEGNETSRSQNEHGIYTSNSGDRPIIRNNVSWGNAACGIHMNGDLSMGGDGLISGALVEGNVIYANGATRGGAAINADGVRDSRFQNNLLYDNHATGIALFRQNGATGSANNIVANNTVVQAADGRFVVYIHGGSTGNALRNNIFYTPHSFRGSIDIGSDSLSGFTSDYNVLTSRMLIDDQWPTLTLAQWQAATGQDLHSLVATPDQLFVNAAAGDYRLSATSPALDRGTSQFAPPRDIVGNSRPSGAAFDIGAYERVANGAPVAVNDEISVPHNTAIEFGVLGNDRDPDGQPLVIGAYTQPASGTLVALAGGNFRYTPASGFSGSDSFTYRASDGALLSNVATVTITVTAAGTGPAAQYRFDETSGATAADSSGNGYHATYVNQPALGQAGVRGGNTAVALNGVNQYVRLPAGPFGNYASGTDYNLSFETWFQAAPGASGVILSQTGSSAAPGGGMPNGYVPAVHLGTDGRIRSSLFWHGSTALRVVSPAGKTYNDGQWHHVAVTYAGGVETLYLDGAAVGQQAASMASYAAGYDYFLGTGFTSSWEAGNGGWHFFGGKLDEALLYRRPLTPAEIAERYAAGKPDEPPPDTNSLTGLYRFDETGGTTAVDSSGRGHDAAYVNQPLLSQPGIQGGNTSVALNGVNQYVALPDGPFGNYASTSDYALSFDVWFKAAPGTSGVILSQTGGGAAPGGAAPNGYVPAVQLGTDGKLRSSLFWHGSTAARIVSPTGRTYNDGQWHHVAVTYANGLETLYVDGLAVGQQTASMVAYAGSYDYFLGTGFTNYWEAGNGGWHFFHGQLDEAAFHGRSLTASEVAERYAAGKPDEPPPDTGAQLTALYHFDESSGSSAIDSSGRDYHATYVNQPLLAQLGTSGGNTSVALNGVNQFVALPAPPFGGYGGTDYTLSFETWFKAAPGTSGVILSQTGSGATPGGGPPNGYVPAVHLGADGKLRSSLFWHGSTGSRIVSPGGQAYNDGQWHHVAVTYASGVETLYIDGVAVGGQTVPLFAYAPGYDYFLGTGYTASWEAGNGGWHFFQGNLDEAAIYQRALSAEEVAQRYAASAAPLHAADMSSAEMSPLLDDETAEGESSLLGSSPASHQPADPPPNLDVNWGPLLDLIARRASAPSEKSLHESAADEVAGEIFGDEEPLLVIRGRKR